MKDRAICDKLCGGDRRSIGRSEEVVADVLRDASKFGAVFAAMWSSDPLIRMRAADAAEKIAAVRPDVLTAGSSRRLRCRPCLTLPGRGRSCCPSLSRFYASCRPAARQRCEPEDEDCWPSWKSSPLTQTGVRSVIAKP